MAKKKRKILNLFNQEPAIDFSVRLSELGKKSMPSDSPNIRTVNNAGVVKNTDEFVYEDGSKVPKGIEYHIHISNKTKEQLYMSGGVHDRTSENIFRKKGDTILGQYRGVKQSFLKTTDYIGPYEFEVKSKHEKLGFARRYFAKRLTDKFVFEVSEQSYNLAPRLYQIISVKWSLSLDKAQMERENIRTIEELVLGGYDELEFVLNPTEGYLGELTSKEEKLPELENAIKSFQSTRGKIRKKKRRIKKGSKKKSGGSAQTTSTTAPPTGGSGCGAY